MKMRMPHEGCHDYSNFSACYIKQRMANTLRYFLKDQFPHADFFATLISFIAVQVLISQLMIVVQYSGDHCVGFIGN